MTDELAGLMSMAESDGYSPAERAHALLVAHQRHGAGCLCGWSELGRSHPRHQVEMLTRAGLLATSGGQGE